MSLLTKIVIIITNENDNTRKLRCVCCYGFRSWGIGELLLMQTAGLEVLGLQWVPDSASEVVMLTSDNCVRLFDISKKHMNALTTVFRLRKFVYLELLRYTEHKAEYDI